MAFSGDQSVAPNGQWLGLFKDLFKDEERRQTEMKYEPPTPRSSKPSNIQRDTLDWLFAPSARETTRLTSTEVPFELRQPVDAVPQSVAEDALIASSEAINSTEAEREMINKIGSSSESHTGTDIAESFSASPEFITTASTPILSKTSDDACHSSSTMEAVQNRASGIALRVSHTSSVLDLVLMKIAGKKILRSSRYDHSDSLESIHRAPKFLLHESRLYLHDIQNHPVLQATEEMETLVRHWFDLSRPPRGDVFSHEQQVATSVKRRFSPHQATYLQFVDAFRAIGPQWTATWLLKRWFPASEINVSTKRRLSKLCERMRLKVHGDARIQRCETTRPFLQLFATGFLISASSASFKYALPNMLTILHNCWGVGAVQAFWRSVRVHPRFPSIMNESHPYLTTFVRKTIKLASHEGRHFDAALLMQLRVPGVHVLDVQKASLQIIEADVFKPDFLRMLDQRSINHDLPTNRRSDPNIRINNSHLNFVDALAQRYAWSDLYDGSRTYRRLNACYEFLVRHRVGPSPTFAQAMTHGAIVKPIARGEYVPMARLRQVMEVVKKTFGEGNADELYEFAWAARQETYKLAERGWRAKGLPWPPNVRLAHRFGFTPDFKPRFSHDEMMAMIRKDAENTAAITAEGNTSLRCISRERPSFVGLAKGLRMVPSGPLAGTRKSNVVSL